MLGLSDLPLLNSSKLSSSEYLTELIGHISSLKVVTASKLSLEKKFDSQAELRPLNQAFEHL